MAVLLRTFRYMFYVFAIYWLFNSSVGWSAGYLFLFFVAISFECLMYFDPPN